MGLSGSGINEENHIVSGSWIACLIVDYIGTILSVPFCPYHFVPYHFVLEPSEALPTTAQILYGSFAQRRNAQATVSKGLAQGPYMAARAGTEPTTLQLRVIDLTNVPPRPTMSQLFCIYTKLQIFIKKINIINMIVISLHWLNAAMLSVDTNLLAGATRACIHQCSHQCSLPACRLACLDRVLRSAA